MVLIIDGSSVHDAHRTLSEPGNRPVKCIHLHRQKIKFSAVDSHHNLSYTIFQTIDTFNV